MANNLEFLDPEYLRLAQSLEVIPKYPGWSQPVVYGIAELLAGWCESTDQARRLVRAATVEMTEWGGVPSLKAIWDNLSFQHDKRSWEPSYGEGAGYFGSRCKHCSDTGVTQPAGDVYADWALCTCKSAQTAGEHLRALNAQVAINRKLRDARLARGRKNPNLDFARVARDLQFVEHSVEMRGEKRGDAWRKGEDAR